MLKCCYSRKKYLSKLKQQGLPDALNEEFLFKCLSVIIYERFIVSIVELIMLSWQPILLYNFHNTKVTWLFITSSSFKFISYIAWKISQFLIFGNCDLSDMTSFSVERASYYRRCPKISEVRRLPFGGSLTHLFSLITREGLDQFQRYAYHSPAF